MAVKIAINGFGRIGKCAASHYLLIGQSFTIRKPSSLTRRRCIRVPPIVQYSPLLPPVGVWAVSQSQCG